MCRSYLPESGTQFFHRPDGDFSVGDTLQRTTRSDTNEEHRLSFRDAMLGVMACQSGCSAVPSEDPQDGRRLGGVEIIDPFTAAAANRLAPLPEPW